MQSVKVQRQEAVSYVGAGLNNDYNVAIGVPVGDTTTTVNLPTGAKIFNVHVVVKFISSTGGDNVGGSWMITKMRKGQTIATEFGAPNGSDWSNIGLSSARNQVIQSYTFLAGTQDAGPYLFDRNVKIPKIYQRLREGDTIIITFNADVVGTLLVATRFKYYM